MAANFLHGVETVEIKKGPVPVTVVKAGVVGLVGIAPKGAKNELKLVQSLEDADQFGDELPGFDIPQALNALLKQGAATVIVVNVFDSTANTTAVTNESQTIVNNKCKTAFAPCGPSAAVVKNAAGTVTYVENTDYTIDSFGVITLVPGGAILNGATISVSYRKLNAASLNAASIIGTIDVNTDTKTGLQLLDDAFSSFGFAPKMIVSAGYSSLNSVAAEMIVKANKYRGRAIVDAPVGTTKADAIAGRGVNGAINFATSSKRAVLVYPFVKAYDAYSNANQSRPYAPFFAGAWCATILQNGFWYSPSNREILGVTGVERTITWAVNDPATDANLLNEVGITTIAQGFGTGIRTWGNRSAAFPSNTHPENFMAVQLTADVLHESLEYAMLQFIDKPINQAWLDSVRETTNSFLRTFIARGAILPGAECTYNPAKNPPVELAAGHVTFDLSFMPPTPAERITFESYVDISALQTLA